jgi:hypothetical protein
MAKKQEQLEIVCDAPPYSVVQASAKVGVQAPEDVRWANITRWLAGGRYTHSSLKGVTRRELLELLDSADWGCRCGKGLTQLVKYRVTFSTGNEAFYYLGQCARCRTVYWSEA